MLHIFINIYIFTVGNSGLKNTKKNCKTFFTRTYYKQKNTQNLHHHLHIHLHTHTKHNKKTARFLSLYLFSCALTKKFCPKKPLVQIVADFTHLMINNMK